MFCALFLAKNKTVDSLPKHLLGVAHLAIDELAIEAFDYVSEEGECKADACTPTWKVDVPEGMPEGGHPVDEEAAPVEEPEVGATRRTAATPSTQALSKCYKTGFDTALKQLATQFNFMLATGNVQSMKTLMQSARTLVEQSQALPGGMRCDLSRTDGHTVRNMKSKIREVRGQITGAKRKVGEGFGGAKTKVQHGRPAKRNKTGLPMSERGKKVDEMHEAGRAAKASAKDATKKAAKEAKDPKGAKATQKVSCVLNGW